MQTPPPARSGMGCFVKGCLTLIIVIFIFCALLIGGGLFVAFNIFTAAEPVQIPKRPASATELQVAEGKLNTLRSAVRNHQEATVEFTADDINALITNEPEFRGARGRARATFANSIASLDMSVPLDSMRWNYLKGRWFNGNVQFGFSYVDDNFSFDVRSAETNGYQFPRWLLSAEFMQSFNRSFNESFHRESSKRVDANDLWRHIKMASLQGDKLIVTTRAE